MQINIADCYLNCLLLGHMDYFRVQPRKCKCDTAAQQWSKRCLVFKRTSLSEHLGDDVYDKKLYWLNDSTCTAEALGRIKLVPVANAVFGHRNFGFGSFLHSAWERHIGGIGGAL